MRFASIEELVAASPAEIGTTDWVTITQADVMAFAGATRAREWVHVDPDRAAREGPFGGPVAHGFLTLALATHFQTQLLELPADLVGINYGIANVRFPAPVPVGSRIRAHGKLAECHRLEAGARLTVSLKYERDGDEKPPCVADIISLVVPAGPKTA